MIHVPSSWPCANHPCAVVRVHDDHFICRVVPCATARTSYNFDPVVRISAAATGRFMSQDYTPPELHQVQWSNSLPSLSLSLGRTATSDVFLDRDWPAIAPSSSHAFAIPSGDVSCTASVVDGNDSSNDELAASSGSVGDGLDCSSSTRTTFRQSIEVLEVRCPMYVYVAKTVTLTGPRIDARATPAHLASVLTGHYVTLGAVVRTADNEEYTVTALEMQSGGFSGMALIYAQCRLRLNAVGRPSAPSTSGVQQLAQLTATEHELIGLDEELTTLTQYLAMPHSGHVHMSFGVLIRGPRGCGVRTLVYAGLHAAKATIDVVYWSNSHSARHDLQQRTACGMSSATTLVLVVRDAEVHFPVDDPAVAKATMRQLERDVHTYSQGEQYGSSRQSGRRCVVVLATTHYYGTRCNTAVMESLFTFHITVALPDVDRRAALLKHYLHVNRGCDLGNTWWRSKAQSLVGKTCREIKDLCLAADADGRLDFYSPPFQAVRWSEIGGLHEAKDRLHKALIWPNEQPEAFAKFGLEPPKGILLYGPPGCAKTTLVRALCSEGYFSFIYLDSAIVQSAYVGESERYLRDVFERAAQQAPCIVFFDEVEVLGSRRSAHGNGNRTDNCQVRLLSTLLTEMDGFARTRGVCFVGATNVPHLLDPALMRPGRFDHLIYIPLPTESDRAAILQLQLSRTHTDVARLASATDGFSGADLNALCTTALLELLGKLDEEPPILRDRDAMTALMLQHVETFRRTEYDGDALECFHREHRSNM